MKASKMASAPDVQARYVKRNVRLARVKSQIPYWLMLLIPLTYFVLICYWPMFGLAAAFQDYRIGDPFLSVDSDWAGLKWFKYLFSRPTFPRMVRNTLTITTLNLVIAFPISIGVALILNEVRNKVVKKWASNISLLPYFISTVCVVSIVSNMFSLDGLVNSIIKRLGGDPILFMSSTKWFRPLYIGSGIWQSAGFNAVVFTAAIAGIDPTLYEAAALDGSSRWKNMIHITIPCIMPTIITMLILRLGSMMSLGAEKILLMYVPENYEVSDVLSTYLYRVGLEDNKLSLATAVGLVNAVCNVVLVVASNRVSKKVSETSLW